MTTHVFWSTKGENTLQCKLDYREREVRRLVREIAQLLEPGRKSEGSEQAMAAGIKRLREDDSEDKIRENVRVKPEFVDLLAKEVLYYWAIREFATPGQGCEQRELSTSAFLSQD
jgi:hypothetical protein